MLSSGWQTALSKARARKVAIVTIDPSGRDPSTLTPHLALRPGAFRFATHTDVDIVDDRTSRTLPFSPRLIGWPTVKRRFVPNERRAEIAEASLEIGSESGLAADMLARGGAQRSTARIDLWTDGLTLQQCQPLLAGRISTAPTIPRRGGGVQLRISDGDPDVAVEFPPGAITRADFPDAPTAVLDVAQRQSIVGPFERVMAAQIDQERRVFYLCDPPVTVSRIQRGGVDIQTGVRTETAQAPSGFLYTRLVFDKPVDEIFEGVTDEVSASGLGLNDQTAIEFLLHVARIELSTSGKAAIADMRSRFDLSALLNKSGNVLDTIRNLSAQTPYAFTLRRNRAHFIDLRRNRGPRVRLGVGFGLRARLAEQGPETDRSSVYNAVEVKCGRDQFGSSANDTASLHRAYADRRNAALDLRSRLFRSEQFYGRRFVSLDANDIGVDYAPDGRIVGSQMGQSLADMTAELLCCTYRPHTYLADWITGLSADWHWRPLLTDEDEGLVDVSTYLSEIEVGAAGPVLTFLEAMA